MMIVELIIPIEALRGRLRQDGFYFRKYKGRQLVQRCPNRKGHVKTPAEARNQERFAERYGKPHLGPPRGGGDTGIKCRANRQRTNSALTRGEGDVLKTMENGKDQEDGTGEAAGGASGAG